MTADWSIVCGPVTLHILSWPLPAVFLNSVDINFDKVDAFLKRNVRQGAYSFDGRTDMEEKSA